MPTQDDSSNNASTFFGIVDAVRQSLKTTNAKDLAALLGPTLAITAMASLASDGDDSSAIPTAVLSLAGGILALTWAKTVGASEFASWLPAMGTYGAILGSIGTAMYATQSLRTGSLPASTDVDRAALVAAYGTQVGCFATLEAARLYAIARTEKVMETLAENATDGEVLACLLE